MGWKDVVVGIEGGAAGRPEVVYTYVRERNVDEGEEGDEGRDGVVGEVAKLSISHDGEYVVATVLAAGVKGDG